MKSSASPGGEGNEANKVGRYEIIHKLASGGMGEVYLAYATGAAGFQKHVVIKKLLPHLLEQKQFVEGLIREAKLLVMLNHPNIVQVLDLGVEGTDYFIAMEYVHGYNLATIIHYCAEKSILIPVSAGVGICLEVLAGLDYAHRLNSPDGTPQNIIHRDVSPQNVMISKEGRVQLTDFGIAKVVNDAKGELTQSLKGKFRYMAPEAVKGLRLDQRYDLFAVGILLFEVLCRRHLFSGKDDMTILNQVREVDVPPLERYHPEISEELARVVHHALHKNPDHRFQSAAEFSRVLRDTIRPMSESDAKEDLCSFIDQLYAKPDFPINKPKLPDLASDRQELTHSLVLESRLAPLDPEDTEPPPRQRARAVETRGRFAILLLTSGLLLVSVAVIYLGYALLVKPKPVAGPKQPVIIVSKRQDQEMPRRPDLGVAQAPDLGPSDQRAQKRVVVPRRRIPRRKAFTQEVGKKTFRKHGRALTRCFNKHADPDKPSVRLTVISSIAKSGRVSEVKLKPAAIGATALGRCIIKVARKIRYPRHTIPVINFVQPLQLKRTSP